MKIPAIKKLVETNSVQELEAAEQALYNEETPAIEVEGSDEGEKLTHILAAIEILKNMENGEEFKTALRNYTQRVRNSIS